MNLHEYQAKLLFEQAQIAVGFGQVAKSAKDIQPALQAVQIHTGTNRWVIKAQLHSGARGKAGGVKLFDDQAAAERFARQLLNTHLVTEQTGADGLPVSAVYIEAPQQIAKEYYFSLTLDRAQQRLTLMVSTEGGMDIETVAAETPEKIFTYTVHPTFGVSGYLLRQMGFDLGLTGETFKSFGQTVSRLVQLYQDCDADLIEINPLILNTDQQWVALDAKMSVDTNALYRHPEIARLRDTTQEHPSEVEASKYELNYIALDGNIGCMVNGAGLAMATLDLIQTHGGQPANFLDVGGGTTAERVANAFKLILSSEQVKVILVNIFGGIVRCDLIADGIIQAVKEVGLSIPVVVRLEGTNAAQGRQALQASALNIIAIDTLDEAAKRAVMEAKA